MTRKDFPGGWYAYALPDGRYVVLNLDGSMDSSQGPIPAPGDSQGCLYPVLNPYASGLVIAGQAWEPGTNRTLVWTGAEWCLLDTVACGVYPCIYNADGILVVNVDCAVGTQGYRYVRSDGTLATGDETYGPTTNWKLWEWTMLAPDLVVGQGENGGVLVYDRGEYRALVPEYTLDGVAQVCRFIHVVTTGQADADQFGLAFWGESGIATACHWGTLAELRALPLDAPPVPPIEPPVPPIEPPETPMPETPNRSDVVQAVYDHGHYDLTTVEGCCIFTQNCAFALHNEDPRWGLLKKNPGQNQCASGTAVDNVLYLHDDPALSVAVDIIHASASPDAAPSWSPDTPRYTVADWLAPDALPVPTAALPRPWVCHSGFDLSQWTPSEMDAWLAVFRASGYNAIRIVPASRFRGPDGEGRTLEEGIIALPAALDACRRAGLWAEVSILVDTGEDYYNLDRSQMSFYVQDVWEECLYHLDVVKCIELANENYHGTQNPALMDTAFLRQLRLHIPLDVPVSWGSTHSEPDGQVIVGGDYITVHSDRGSSPDNNGQAMADLQARFGRPVIDDEPLGLAEQKIPGKRTNDPDYATQLGHAIVDHELGGGTFHCEAGMYADLSKLGPIQRDGLERYTAARGVSPVPPIPPIPPPSGHPILDHPLVPVEQGYRFWVANRVDITIAAHDWYVRSHGWQPAESDISHGLWRGMNEGERWLTLRNAWEDTWPGGAPK